MSKKLMQSFCMGARKFTTLAPMTIKTSFLCSNPKFVRKPPKYLPNFFIHSTKSSEPIGKRGEDEQLIQVLQSEISYEQSKPEHYEEADKALLGFFVVDSDLPDSQDVVLRRSYDRESIAITALLGPHGVQELEVGENYSRSVLMKVCITKAGVASILQFDCRLQGYGNDVIVHRISYHDSPPSLQSCKYRGPTFSSLDYDLVDAFKEFLEARGISADLASFLIVHLHNKEQCQYVQWLHYLDCIIKKGMESD